MAIYDRMNPQLSAALESALSRREAFRQRQNERNKHMVNSMLEVLPVAGRSLEMATTDIPDAMRNDPTYTASRYDYVFSGDRSGLDTIRTRLANEETLKQQQEFTKAENEANRKLQRESAAHSKIMDKARLLANLNNSRAVLKDAESNPSKYSTLDVAKARNDVKLQEDLARQSGLFTAEELSTPKTGKTLDELLADSKKATPETPPAGGEETPKSWAELAPEVKRLYSEAKTSEDIAKADEKAAELMKDEANADKFEELKAHGNKERERVAKAEEAKRYAAAQEKAGKEHSFSVSTIRNALKMGVKGGGEKEAQITFPMTYGKKTVNVPAKAVKDGNVARIYVNGKEVQTVKLTLGD